MPCKNLSKFASWSSIFGNHLRVEERELVADPSRETSKNKCAGDPQQHWYLSGADHWQEGNLSHPIMGCVSSKDMQKQVLSDESPVKRKLSRRSSKNHDVSPEDYHRHLVALTSSTYGLLKVDTPNTPQNGKKSTVRMASMNDMYDKLKVLESLESTPKSWNEVSDALQTLKPSLGRSISMPEEGLHKVDVQETINVADIMEGLEEEASGSSSPVQNVCSLTAASSVIPLSPPPPPLSSVLDATTCKNSVKAISFHNPMQDLRMLPVNANKNLPTLLPKEVSRNLTHMAESHGKVDALGRLDENVQPLNAEQKFPTRSNSRVHQQNQQNPHVLTKSAKTTNKSVAEDKYGCRDNQMGLNPTVPSNLAFSTSSRRLTLTLNLEYESAFFPGISVSQDASSPAGSSARRSLVDVLTEPGSPLFDPALLASYEKALKELRREEWSIVLDSNELPEKTSLTKEPNMHVEDPQPVQISEVGGQIEPGKPSDADEANADMEIQSYDPLDEYEWKCPPNGEEIVVLYTTTLRGIRKTFEDCNNVREMLHSFSIGIDERDVSMHATFRNELRELMGGPVSVPRVFIKGRYIGGVDDATKLHEEGKLAHLLEGLPKDLNTDVCDGCGGVRFVPCLECSGSCKIIDQDKKILRCIECNENGLIHCPLCS